MRLTMERRVLDDSNLMIAPQKGNKIGAAALELLSVTDADADNVWIPSLQRIPDI